jgi:hypothetical protein
MNRLNRINVLMVFFNIQIRNVLDKDGKTSVLLLFNENIYPELTQPPHPLHPLSFRRGGRGAKPIEMFHFVNYSDYNERNLESK